MTEKFYKDHLEHFFRERKARLTVTHQTRCGNDEIKAGREVVIKRKYKGLGVLDPRTDIFIPFINPQYVELITDEDGEKA